MPDPGYCAHQHKIGSVLAGIENEFDGAFTMLHMAR
jgi:hypothetical protein